MKKNFIKKLENKNNIEIHNFEYCSNDFCKASFDMCYVFENISYILKVEVFKIETYQDAIERVIEKFIMIKTEELVVEKIKELYPDVLRNYEINEIKSILNIINNNKRRNKTKKQIQKDWIDLEYERLIKIKKNNKKSIDN
jgi:hypothetical protein